MYLELKLFFWHTPLSTNRDDFVFFCNSLIHYIKTIAFVSGFVTECLSRGAAEEHNSHVRSEVPVGLELPREDKERAGMCGARLGGSLQPLVC